MYACSQPVRCHHRSPSGGRHCLGVWGQQQPRIHLSLDVARQYPGIRMSSYSGRNAAKLNGSLPLFGRDSPDRRRGDAGSPSVVCVQMPTRGGQFQLQPSSVVIDIMKSKGGWFPSIRRSRGQFLSARMSAPEKVSLTSAW